MKKTVSLLLVLSMVTALSSCSDKKQSSQDGVSSQTDTTAVQTTQPAAEETTQEELEEPDYPSPAADENAITFDNSDDIYTAHCMGGKDYSDDESKCNISVAEYKGNKQLKIEVLDKNDDQTYKTPKIVFDMDELVGSENLSKVKSFSADITQAAVGDFLCDDGVERKVPGNLMGTFGSNVGEKCDWYEPTGSSNGFAAAEWNFEWEYLHVEGKWLLKGFADGTEDSTLVFMRWSIPNQADIYIDNLTFYDENGKSVPIVYQPVQ